MSEKHPLAFDCEGNPIDLPAEAVAWRVRRGGGRRGRPKLLFDRETGRQLEIPLEATLDDLVDCGFEPDRYRLEAVDISGHLLPGLVAVVEVPDPEDSVIEQQKSTEATALENMSRLVGQLVEANCRAMAAMASAFGPVEPARAPAAPPMVIAERSRPDDSVRPEQMMQSILGVAKIFADTLKSVPVTPAPTGGGS